MATAYLHRLFICVPDSLREEANTWISNKLDPTGAAWLSVPISADGNLPATYWGCDVALTKEQLKILVKKLLQFTNADLPDNWDGRSLTQIRTYAKNTLPTKLWKDAQAGKKIGILYIENDGDWAGHKVDDALDRVNLKRVVVTPEEG